MISRIFALSKAVLKNWMRSREGVFFSFLFPVMLLLLFTSIFGGQGGSSFTLYVQNLDVNSTGGPTNLSTSFLDTLNSTGAFSIRHVPYEVDPRDYVQDEMGVFGGTFRLLIIPEDFENDLLNGSLRTRIAVSKTTAHQFLEQAGDSIPPEQRAGIEIGLGQMDNVLEDFPEQPIALTYVSDSNSTSALVVESVIRNVATSFNSALIGVEPSMEIEKEEITRRKLRSVDYYLPAIIGAFIMTNGIIGVTTNTTEFKRRGVLRRFATTPMSRLDWVVGNVISQTILSFMLVLVMFVVAWVVFDLQAIPNALTLIYVAVGAILFSGIGLILSGLVKDVEAASAAGNAVAFPMMFLSGTFWSPEIMPGYLQTVAEFLPLTYFSNGLRAAFVLEHIPSALTNLAVLIGMAVVFIIVGSLVTKWQE